MIIEQPARFLRWLYPNALWRMEQSQRSVYLTFDDGPSERTDEILDILKQEGINKVAMLVFARNETGNAFWETEGFTSRADVIYRNKELSQITRIDT